MTEDASYDSSGVFTVDPRRAAQARLYRPEDVVLKLGHLGYELGWPELKPVSLAGDGFRLYLPAPPEDLMREVSRAWSGRTPAQSLAARDLLAIMQALSQEDMPAGWALRITGPGGSRLDLRSARGDPYAGWLGPLPGGLYLSCSWGMGMFGERLAFHPISARRKEPALPFQAGSSSDCLLVARHYELGGEFPRALPVAFPCADRNLFWGDRPAPGCPPAATISWLASFSGDLPPADLGPDRLPLTRPPAQGWLGSLRKHNFGPAQFPGASARHLPARWMLGIRRDLQGTGRLYIVQRGVTLHPLELNWGIPGLFAVLADDHLPCDASGLKPVDGPALQTALQPLIAQANTLLQRLRELLEKDPYTRKYILARLPERCLVPS